ncbi:Protein FixC [Trichinella pseudospiralis]
MEGLRWNVVVVGGGSSDSVGSCDIREKGQQGLKQPCGQYSRGDEPAGRHRHAGALSLIDYRDSCPVEAMNEPTRESGSLQFNELKNPFGGGTVAIL